MTDDDEDQGLTEEEMEDELLHSTIRNSPILQFLEHNDPTSPNTGPLSPIGPISRTHKNSMPTSDSGLKGTETQPEKVSRDEISIQQFANPFQVPQLSLEDHGDLEKSTEMTLSRKESDRTPKYSSHSIQKFDEVSENAKPRASLEVKSSEKQREVDDTKATCQAKPTFQLKNCWPDVKQGTSTVGTCPKTSGCEPKKSESKSYPTQNGTGPRPFPSKKTFDTTKLRAKHGQTPVKLAVSAPYTAAPKIHVMPLASLNGSLNHNGRIFKFVTFSGRVG